MRIGENASGAEYWMDKNTEICKFLEISLIFEIVKFWKFV